MFHFLTILLNCFYEDMQFLHFLSYASSQRNHCCLRSFLQWHFSRFLLSSSSITLCHVFPSCLLILFIPPQMPKVIANHTSNLHSLEKKDRILFTMAFRNVLFFFFACLICIMKYFYACCISLAQFYINWGQSFFSYLFLLKQWSLAGCAIYLTCPYIFIRDIMENSTVNI